MLEQKKLSTTRTSKFNILPTGNFPGKDYAKEYKTQCQLDLKDFELREQRHIIEQMNQKIKSQKVMIYQQAQLIEQLKMLNIDLSQQVSKSKGLPFTHTSSTYCSPFKADPFGEENNDNEIVDNIQEPVEPLLTPPCKRPLYYKGPDGLLSSHSPEREV